MKSIKQYIKPSLSHKSQHFDEILKILLACLPDSCQSHVSIAKVDYKTLVVVTDSSVWASRLRLYSNTMLEMIKQHSAHDITQIKISQVQTRLEIKPHVNIIHREMNLETQRLLTQTADCIEDKELQNALLKLAKRAK